MKKCTNLQDIVFPRTFIKIERDFFLHFSKLQKITLSDNLKFNGNRLFGISIERYLFSVLLPSTVTTINNQKIQFTKLTSITIPSSVTKLQDYCFYNCCDLTKVIGLEHIKEFGKGSLTNCPILTSESTPELKRYYKQYCNSIISTAHMKQLEKWSGMIWDGIIFDSDVDDWDVNSSIFNNRIIGKKYLVFLIEDGKGEKFGYYLNTEINGAVGKHQTDEKTFHFNLISNGRLSKPMKFEINDIYSGGYFIYSTNNNDLIEIGDIKLNKRCYNHIAKCQQNNYHFNYHEIQNALSGNNSSCHSKRITVIQMKENPNPKPIKRTRSSQEMKSSQQTESTESSQQKKKRQPKK